MAQIVETQLVDDLDGRTITDVRTTTFAFEKTAWEIELSSANYSRLREALDPYIKAGRKANGSKRPQRATAKRAAAPASGPSNDELRAWAAEHKLKCSARGRIPLAVHEHWAANH